MNPQTNEPTAATMKPPRYVLHIESRHTGRHLKLPPVTNVQKVFDLVEDWYPGRFPPPWHRVTVTRSVAWEPHVNDPDVLLTVYLQR